MGSGKDLCIIETKEKVVRDGRLYTICMNILQRVWFVKCASQRSRKKILIFLALILDIVIVQNSSNFVINIIERPTNFQRKTIRE